MNKLRFFQIVSLNNIILIHNLKDVQHFVEIIQSKSSHISSKNISHKEAGVFCEFA